MKKIEAIIRPEMSQAVVAALEAAGYAGIMVTEIKGHGKQRGVTEQWRGQTYQVSFLPKLRFELVVKDADLQKIITAIATTAKTGAVGDGKIFVSDISDVVRIRTGERGEVAV